MRRFGSHSMIIQEIPALRFCYEERSAPPI